MLKHSICASALSTGASSALSGIAASAARRAFQNSSRSFGSAIEAVIFSGLMITPARAAPLPLLANDASHMYQPGVSGVNRTSRASPFLFVCGGATFSHPSRLIVTATFSNSTASPPSACLTVKMTSCPSG
jgi:hypothetical protein